MEQRALLIFIKNPVKGKVKTRLAEAIGDEKALKIYRVLLNHTHLVCKKVKADKLLFYSDVIDKGDRWENTIFTKMEQKGGDLGERMKNAFLYAFEKGYQKVCIIGSDCYQLDEKILQKAFDSLNSQDLVIGPANDGGYYLLGMKGYYPQFFENKQWSHENVFEEALEEAGNLDLKTYILPELIDVDIAEDALQSELLKPENNKIN